MSDDFTKNKLDWLDQVAADPTLTPAAFKAAYVLSGYINRETGEAWPTQETIAAAVGLTDRAIRPLLRALVDAGHLACQSGRGRHRPNVYRLTLKNRKQTSGNEGENRKQTSPYRGGKPEADFRLSGKKTGSFASKNRKFPAQKPEADFRQNTMKEHTEEHIEGDISLSPDFCSEGRQPSEDRGQIVHLPVAARPRRKESDLERDFEDWWTHVPRKASKGFARSAYRRVIERREATREDLLAGIMRYAAERDGQDPRFTKHPATWLNQGCWADEPVPAFDRASAHSSSADASAGLGAGMQAALAGYLGRAAE